MTRYFDTSSLVKYFHVESGSETVTALIQDQHNISCISELAGLEFMSALCRRFRNKELTAIQLEIAFHQFEAAKKNFNIILMDSSVIAKAEQLLEKYGRGKGLRTLDALHLASYLLHEKRTWQFVVSDHHLHEIASGMGIRTLLID
jgi:predicted nucleic acid-binding protein